MKHLFPCTLLFAAMWLMEACSPGTAGTNHPCIPETYTISKDSLLDKIKGGWAGQAIGCTYGGPTEFKYCGTMIQDYVPIEWYDGYIKWWYDNVPGLYDDVYMDLTFVDVFDRLGLDAPADSFIIRKTKCFDFWERNVLFPKTKRSFFRTPKHPLPCPFPLNFSLLIITKKFGNLAKNRYICIV